MSSVVTSVKVHKAGRLTVIVDACGTRVALSTYDARRLAGALVAAADDSEADYARDVRENGRARWSEP